MNFYFYKAPLILAIEKENTEIVEMLLKNFHVDVNAKTVFSSLLFYTILYL